MLAVPLSDELLTSLVAEAQQGSRAAADRLVRAHEGWVRGVVFGITGRPDLVDDIVQQVWSQFWERIESLQEPRRLKSWLYAVARNAAIDAGQARKRRDEVRMQAAAQTRQFDVEGNPALKTSGDEVHGILLQAVGALPAIYREPFVLRHLEDWTYAEIGELLNMSVETVETRLVRARRLLREMVKGRIDA
ncbi:MAG: RNA polymerase sigma factor [Phycisphaerae bacterium]